VRRTGTSDRGGLVFYSNTSIAPIIYPITCKCQTPGNLLHWHFRRLRRFGSSFALPRAAADTRGQHSALRYTGASMVRYAMREWQKGAQERRREGGTRERGRGQKRSLGLLVARQQELG
jgi:hypothetical protein